MSPSSTVRTLIIASAVVLFIGSVDAGIGGEWDLFVLILFGFLISIALLLHVESKRPAVPIRRDLVAWLRDRADSSGEPLTAVTDRAVATFAENYGVVVEVDEARQ
jgi:hypothetical protein